MTINKENAIFLLGGHDLEMFEIKRILLEHGFKEDENLFDKNLSWDIAKLSAYREEMEANKYKNIYAVELNTNKNNAEDKALLDRYEIDIIDHHGEDHNNKEASLLQLLKLLGKKPTREQELIAANDARYITGMKCMGAKEKEIVEIRKRDREKQGASRADEVAGKNDARSRKVENDIAIVCATTPYFSTITDSLYFDFEEKDRLSKSIIYSDEEIVFYGFDLERLKALCRAHCIPRKVCYFGGGNSGYFGIKNNAIKPKIMEKLIDVLVQEKTLYSSHIFMFPFRFDYVTRSGYSREFEFYKDNPIDERVNIKELLNKLNKDKNWNYQPFNLSNVLKEKQVKYYNEFSYFYDYAKEALYNLQKFEDKDTFYNDEISYYFEHNRYSKKDKEDTKLILNYQHYNMDKRYILQIDGVSLRIFQTGVAILSIEIKNYDYSKLSDVKNINEYTRRFYPQYLRKGDSHLSNPPFLAKSIEITDGTQSIVEDFDVAKVCIPDTNSVRVGKHIMDLLGGQFSQEMEQCGRFYIQPIMDDRMFVLCWYGDDCFTDKLKKDEKYTNDKSWYEYVFIDKHDDATVQNEWMKNELIYNATYDRWSEWGTIFGITRYSLVALTDAGPFGRNVINTHMNTMYFQMMMLLLTTRASILRFSDEVAAIANLGTAEEESRLSGLYAKYLSFYNRLYFKEVTHQDQGIELYDMGLKQMKIPEHIEKLNGKFSKLHDFANLKTSNRESDGINRLTMLGAVLLIPSLVTSMVGLDALKEYASFAVVLSFVLGGTVAWILSRKKSDRESSKKSHYWSVFFAFLAYILIVCSCNGSWKNHIVPWAKSTIDSAKSNTVNLGKYLYLYAPDASSNEPNTTSQQKGEK